MTTDITSLQLNSTKKVTVDIAEAIKKGTTVGPSFLKLTNNQIDTSSIKGVVLVEDVLSGEIEDQIKNTQTETDIINSVLNNNTDGSNFDSNKVFTAKKIEFEAYEPTKTTNSTTEETGSTAAPTPTTNSNIKTKTSTNEIYKNIQYSSNYNQEVQERIIKEGIDKLINWLDDYINNYDAKVAEGKERGDSEVKLSFLLRLRKAIETCDFPIGFGNDEYFAEASGEGYVVLGAYSASYNTSYYLNPEDHANDNVGALTHGNRSIILNAGVFCINRKYKNEYQVQKAYEYKDFDYLFEEGVTQEEINQAYADIILSSDDVYYDYASTYFASILAHELIHSTHITNEAVTYNTCEMLEDDFRGQLIKTDWDPKTQAVVDSIFTDVNLNELTFEDIFLPTGNGGGLGFHDLGNTDDVANHGHNENMAYNTDITYDDGTIAYKAYTNFTTGNTLEDDKKELLNFIV